MTPQFESKKVEAQGILSAPTVHMVQKTITTNYVTVKENALHSSVDMGGI